MAKLGQLLERLKDLVGADGVAEDPGYGSGIAASVTVGLGRLQQAMEAGRDVGFFLEAITALDFTDTNELVYHLNCYEPGSRIAVRVLCGKDQAVPSVTGVFASAQWQEREVWEFFGIAFTGHPDLKPLLLPEELEFHPLKKDFGKVHAYRKREEIYE